MEGSNHYSLLLFPEVFVGLCVVPVIQWNKETFESFHWQLGQRMEPSVLYLNSSLVGNSCDNLQGLLSSPGRQSFPQSMSFNKHSCWCPMRETPVGGCLQALRRAAVLATHCLQGLWSHAEAFFTYSTEAMGSGLISGVLIHPWRQSDSDFTFIRLEGRTLLPTQGGVAGAPHWLPWNFLKGRVSGCVSF